MSFIINEKLIFLLKSLVICCNIKHILFQESVCLFIPIFSIKAIVGIIGSNINDMTDVSGAKIHILPRIVENPIAPDQFCHKVNVIGTCKAQWEVKFEPFLL